MTATESDGFDCRLVAVDLAEDFESSVTKRAVGAQVQPAKHLARLESDQEELKLLGLSVGLNGEGVFRQNDGLELVLSKVDHWCQGSERACRELVVA